MANVALVDRTPAQGSSDMSVAPVPWWADRCTRVETLCVVDDAMAAHVARARFGGALHGFRLGRVAGHRRQFGLASWLTAVAGEGLLASGEIGVPLLVPTEGGGRGARVALLDVEASACAQFYLGQPGVQLASGLDFFVTENSKTLNKW